MSRDRSFTATKSKETILAQENTEDSGMRKLIPHDFSMLVATYDREPKVGINFYQLSHARIFSVLLCQNCLIPCFLTFCSSERSIPTHFLNFKFLFILVCLLFIAYLHKYIIVFTSTCPIAILYIPL